MKKTGEEETLRFNVHLRSLGALLYSVGILVLLAAANFGVLSAEVSAEVNRTAVNVIAAVAVLLVLAIFLFPWERFSRNLFFAVPAVGTVIVTLTAYFSGGWDSFAYVLYPFAVVYYALCFPPKTGIFGVATTILAGATPMLYEPGYRELAEYSSITAPTYVALMIVSGYTVRQVVLAERDGRERELKLEVMRERQDQLLRQSEVDGLTGVSNRRYLERRLGEELRQSRHPGGSFAVLFVDVDDFKQVNDLYGHLTGDEALKLVATTFETLSRKVDTVARYGGEEFVVLMPGARPEDARLLFERTLREVSREAEDRLGFQIRMSAGAVSSRSERGVTELLSAADKAMYEAKRRGKNRVFTPEVSSG